MCLPVCARLVTYRAIPIAYDPQLGCGASHKPAPFFVRAHRRCRIRNPRPCVAPATSVATATTDASAPDSQQRRRLQLRSMERGALGVGACHGTRRGRCAGDTPRGLRQREPISMELRGY